MLTNSTNSYQGGTLVNNGELVVNTAGALPTNTGLTVSGNGVFLFSTGFTWTYSGTSPGFHAEPAAHSAGVESVPEPTTLALLIVGAAMGLGVWLRKRGARV